MNLSEMDIKYQDNHGNVFTMTWAPDVESIYNVVEAVEIALNTLDDHFRAIAHERFEDGIVWISPDMLKLMTLVKRITRTNDDRFYVYNSRKLVMIVDLKDLTR